MTNGKCFQFPDKNHCQKRIAALLLKEKIMNLHIEKHMTLAEVQAAFNHSFPFLKIGFFIDKNHDNTLTADEQIHNLKMTIGSIREIEYDGDLKIEATMTAKEVETAFWDTFGLDIQVFRKSGNAWLVTTSTDSRTLLEQNEIAREMNSPAENPELPDYQEHE